MPVSSSTTSPRPNLSRSNVRRAGALGLGQPRSQWMAAVQFIAPECRDHQQALGSRVSRQEREQVAC